MRVLVIEDDELVASGIIAGLRLSGIEADHVSTVSSAETAAQTSRFDVAILDLGLPDADGLSLLRRWRAGGKNWPVLVLTARDAVQDKVAGLRSGADDYLVKPFELDELVARLHALQRRSAGRSVDLIEHGPLVFDAATREVTLHGKLVDLSRRELALLQTLLNSGKRILSAEQVKDSLYGFGERVESNALNVHIHHLRRKLGPHIVETVRGLGYRLGKVGE
ncbi:response regulator [Massilia horti]|uniref:Response regulator n=1 Tax=Massilia horti TaxID=2562153 RepID=A0A4Y9SZQ8_9BURK|nr:response regulator [Massilia horti]TFW32236.1 response regulator [Massilia horti]